MIIFDANQPDWWGPPHWDTPRLYPGQKIFYGGNTHWDFLSSGAQLVTQLKTMNFKVARITYEGNSASLAMIVRCASAMAADNTGLRLTVNIDVSMLSDETSSYNKAYSQGAHVCTTLQPFKDVVIMYEAGNELETKNGINPSGAQGTKPSDFDNTKWPMLRGATSGAIDGVRSVQQDAVIASNAFTRCAFAASDMLWNGTNPDGSQAPKQVRWDVTNWHNYEDYGSMFHMYKDFSVPGVLMNLMEYLYKTYQKPIFITEWNAKASDTDAQRATWAQQVMREWWDNRKVYNIAGIVVYQLSGGSPWAVLSSTDTTVQTTFGDTVKTFIGNCPDT